MVYWGEFMKNKSVIRLFFYGMLVLFVLQGFVKPTELKAAINVWVATDGSDTSGDGSVSLPYATISFALSKTGPGDTLQIKGGTYTETISIVNKEDFVLRGADPADTVYVRGLQAGAVISYDPGTVPASRAMRFENLVISHADTSLHGAGMEILGGAPVLRGVVFRGNKVTGNRGGGLTVSTTGTTRPLIEYCDFYDNYGDKGAGIYSTGSIEIRYSRFFRNQTLSGSGGAVYFAKASGLRVYNNRFFGNVADSGGALYVSASATNSLTQNVFTANFLTNNRASSTGGAFYYKGKDVISAVVENNTFAENQSDQSGGAMFIENTSGMLIRENIIVSNNALGDGGAIYLKDISSATITMWSNSVSGNQAGNNGGALYIDNVTQLSIGDAFSQRNNFFHNRNASQINNITSKNSISNLSLAHNYWGTNDQSSIISTLDIPQINTSWSTFDTTPADTRVKLVDVLPKIWFADGSLDFGPAGEGIGLSPVADSIVIIRTLPDTMVALDGADVSLPKNYTFNWQSNILPEAVGKLTFLLDSSELNYLGNPLPNTIKAYYDAQGSWQSLPSTVEDSGKRIQIDYNDPSMLSFGIGVKASGLDSVLFVQPRPFRTDVDPAEDISILFQKDMNPATLNNNTIFIYGEGSGRHHARFAYDSSGRRLLIQVDESFMAGEEVTVILTDRIELSSGENFVGYSWQYTVSSLRGAATLIPAALQQVNESGVHFRIADFDGDHIPELVRLESGTLTVLKRNGSGVYQINHQTGVSFYNVLRIADINGDGQPEIILLNNGTIEIFPYDVFNGFGVSSTLDVNTGAYLTDVLILDLNSDGVPDFALLRDYVSNYSVDIYPGSYNGSYSLGSPLTNFLSGSPSHLSVLDSDADGLPDLLVNEVSSTSAVSVLVNKKDSFSRNELAVNFFNNQQDLSAANVWQTGGEDESREIIVAGSANGLSDRVDVYAMISSTALQLRDSLHFSANVNAVAAADINSDGYLDIITLTADSSLHLWFSRDGALVEKSSQKLSFDAQKLITADLDGDGDRDVLIYGDEEVSTRWQLLENKTRNPRAWWVDGSFYASAESGSLQQPFKTIRQAIAHSYEGDTVMVSGRSVYRENLTVKHSLKLSSWDSARVVLLPDDQDLFAREVLSATAAAQISITNWVINNDKNLTGWSGLMLDRVDSLYINGLSVTGFSKGLALNRVNGLLKNISAEDNERGIEGDSSDVVFKQLVLTGNSASGLSVRHSQVKIDTADISGNNLNAVSGEAGLSVTLNSRMEMDYAHMDSNRGANILLSNSELKTRLVYLGKSLAGEYGLRALNNAQLTLENSVVAENAQTGIQLNNSNGEIINTLFIGNDSLGANNGSAVVLDNGSDFLIHNSIFVDNGTGINNVNGSARIRYNNFWGNQNNISGAVAGPGNRQLDPLFVFQYNPLGIKQGVDGFENLKLAAGSPLIDAGDPTVKNEGTASRSDIGLYGNLGAPYMIAESPQVEVSVLDSSLVLSWQAPQSVSGRSLWGGMAIFRGTEADFIPDTLNLLHASGRDVYDYEDRSMIFGTDYFYKLAYLDSNGAAIGYGAAVEGRIDFGAFSLTKDTLNVQLGQGDTLQRPLVVKNTGTLPVAVSVSQPQVSWLAISPDTLVIEVGESRFFRMQLSARGLEKDSIYTTRFSLSMVNDPDSEREVLLRMLVSYRDLLQPVTRIVGSYPDTLLQTGVTIRFSGDDTSNSSIGTPTKLLSYEYRLTHNGALYQQDTVNSASVSFYPLPEGLYRFDVAALDTAYNGGLSENAVSLRFAVKAPRFVIRKKRWQFLSLPFDLSAAGEVDLSSIRAIKYWNRDAYVNVKPDSLIAGHAYWMVTDKFAAVNTANYKTFDSDSGRVIPLNLGWNMIGSPWNWDISVKDMRIVSGGSEYTFEQAIDDSLINGSLFYYNNLASDIEPYIPQAGNAIGKHKGYWLYAYRAGELYINPTPYMPEEVSVLEKTARLLVADEDAIFKLKAQRGQETVENYYSVLSQKEKYPFIYRGAIEPPAISKRLRMFTRRNALAHLSDFVTRIPGDSVKQWQLTLDIPEGQASTSLSWDIYSRGNGIHYFLYHLEKGEWFDVSQRQSYDLGNARGKQHFRLYASRNAGFSPRVLPTRFELGQNYPNPFNPETTIRIRVPFYASDKNARLTVYDVLGRKVIELFNKKVKSGEIKVKWDGRNQFGGQVASGIYFYRFEADKFVSSKKMILIR